jgi:hypothetical protein
LVAKLFPKAVYVWTRDLHLYAGLFLSPFVLLFALSAVFLNHNWRPGPLKPASVKRTVTGLRLPEGLERSEGMDRVQKVRQLLPQIGVTGEVSYINYEAGERRMQAPVQQAGRTTDIDIDFTTSTAKLSERTTGVWDGLIFLHKMPGPHLVAIRKNWVITRLWSYLADATVYLLFFLTATGIYLWLVVKAERRTGLILAGAGVLSFCVVIYGLCG